MFSVVIPLYNKELSIRNTIQSVLDQTFQEFEIVIVNDGSTDKSVEVVQSIDNSRIRLIHQENCGVSAARNKGINEANYEWIAFLDGDDLWKTNHLEVILQMMELYPQNKVFTTSFIRSTKKENKLEDDSIYVIKNYFKEALEHHITWTSIVCVNKEVFDKVGVFNIELNRGEDLDLWARLAKSYKIVKSSKITGIYKIESENNLTGKKSELDKSILSIISLKGLKGSERTYFKCMVWKRIRASLRDLSLKEIFLLLKKHNLELLK